MQERRHFGSGSGETQGTEEVYSVVILERLVFGLMVIGRAEFGGLVIPSMSDMVG